MILSGWLNHLVAAFGSTEISGKRIPKEADERYERILGVQARVSSSRARGCIDLEIILTMIVDSVRTSLASSSEALN